jgi:hypothetical protein
MLLGFVEAVCPHRKSYKAKWMDNEDGGWVLEFQMSAARANQPLFFTLSVFQPNRSTGDLEHACDRIILLEMSEADLAKEYTDVFAGRREVRVAPFAPMGTGY